MAAGRRQRSALRYKTKFRAVVVVHGQELPAKLRNISTSGCLVVLRRSKVDEAPDVDSTVRLLLQADDVDVDCSAVVRHVRDDRELLKRVLLLGVEFDDEDFDTRKQIEQVVARARINSKVDAEAARWLGLVGGGQP